MAEQMAMWSINFDIYQRVFIIPALIAVFLRVAIDLKCNIFGTYQSTGKNISQSMEEVGFFPGVAVKMAQIGENSGSLATVMEKTSEYYEKKVDGLVSMMLGMLEPILIISVGGIVLVVILAMYLPIFSMSV